MKFKSLKINEWRQYQKIDIDFHDRMTIITGANGSGKTTILSLLGQHYSWGIQLLVTPDSQNYLNVNEDVNEAHPVKLVPFLTSKGQNIGTVTYSDGENAKLQIGNVDNLKYSIAISRAVKMRGFHIPSHRPLYSYEAITEIPTTAMNAAKLYNNYSGLIKEQGPYKTRSLASFGEFRSPLGAIKASLISLAVFGGGNEYVDPDIKGKTFFEGFQDVLRKMLPPKIGFRKFSIRMPEVVLETNSGDFLLDTVSGGMGAVIDMAWRIYSYSPEGEPFVCTIDEPENHLHPELQQSLLPNLISAFPNVQFIITTHNPFMITAVEDSYVYVLDYNKNNRVESGRLDAINKAGTANEVLRDVLGLPFTMPLWAENRLETIFNKYAHEGVSDENIALLEAELKEAGLSNAVFNTDAKLTSKDSL